jgi:hypothetical protein
MHDQWVGQPATKLVVSLGMPTRQLTAPSGAIAYLYDDTEWGNIVCTREYYVRNGKVVGYRNSNPWYWKPFVGYHAAGPTGTPG